MLRRCSMSRRCLWLALPLVAGHLGCLALPAATLALGAPILMPMMPICGGPPDVVTKAMGKAPLDLAQARLSPQARSWPP